MLEHEEFAQEGTIIRDILRAKRAAMPELTNQDIAFSIFINETGGTTVRLEGPFQKTGCSPL